MSKIKRYSYIVNKQFKVNRKRNISTISGIILSIILFTIVGYIQRYYNEVNILDAKNRKGNYEAVLTGMSTEDIDKLKNNVLVDGVGLYTEKYNSTINIGDKEKHIKVYSVDDFALEELFSPIMELTKGRLPQKNNEILIDSVAKYSLEKNIGDTLKLGEKDYKIVGTYDKKNSPEPYNIELITYFNKEKNLKNINAAFNVKHQKDKEQIIRKVAENLGVDSDGNVAEGLGINSDNNGEKALLLNQLIFYHYGNTDPTMGNIFNSEELVEIMIYVAILILTVFMTYGAINISIKERIEQFSILRCMGATPGKIRNLLIRESFLLGIFSIIPGVILGQLICLFISAVILKNIFIVTIPYQIYPSLIGEVVLLSILNIVVSTIIPVIRIGKISPIEGVKNGGEINNKVRKRNSKVINEIFGYNGMLAYKNITGNNRSFLITTITSIMILTTFIIFSGYSNNSINEYNKEKNQNKDITLDINTEYENTYTDVFKGLDRYKKEVKDLGVTKEVFGRVEYFLSGTFENVEFNKWIKEKNYNNNGMEIRKNNHGKTRIHSKMINLLIMDDNSLKELLSSVENNKLTLADFKENGVLISDIMVAKNFMNMERQPLFQLKKNEKFTLQIDNENLNEKTKKLTEKNKNIDLKYLGSINAKEVLGGYGFGELTTLIVSKDFYNDNKGLFIKNNENDLFKNEVNLLRSERMYFEFELKPNLNREVALKTIENYTNQIEGTYIDNKNSNWHLESQVLVISSMVYLIMFLTMIVGGLNLINNKNISIKLRQKEMGTLLALGINKKRLKKILMLEGIMQWFISTGVSLILSYIILTIFYKIMIYNGQIIEGKIPILATIFGCSILFIINVLGSYLPIRKLEYTNTTELIRNKE